MRRSKTLTSRIVYTIVAVGFVAAGVFAFSDRSLAAGLLLLTVGAVSIVLARALAQIQSEIDKTVEPIVANPWGKTRPQLFIIWGIGVAVLGFAFLFRLI